MKIKQHIIILRSSVIEFSSMGQRSATALQATLALRYADVEIKIVNCLDDLRLIVKIKPDLVFIGTHSLPLNRGSIAKSDNDVWTNSYLTERGITCTGSQSSAHMLENNKALAKQRVSEKGLATSSYFATSKSCNLAADADKLAYPMFVKPLNMGGGSGIDEKSVVSNIGQLQAKVLSIRQKYNSDCIVEHYLSGREFSVAILKNLEADGYYVMPLELIAPKDSKGNQVLSEAVKENDSESFVAVTDKLLKFKISQLAHKVFLALGAQDYGRIDIRLDQHGNPQFLEANLIPSVIEGYGNFPKACLINEGITYKEAMFRIVDLALLRTELTQKVFNAKPVVASIA